MLPGETILPEMVQNCTTHPKPVVLVYFIGGVTYGEVATLRLLGKLLSKLYVILSEKEIVIATTEVINGDSFVRSFLDSDLSL